MTVAFPRFDDIYKTAGVSAGCISIASDEGHTFAKSMEMAMSSGAPMIQIATWNDWGEGTQIEPSHDLASARAHLAIFSADSRAPKP